MTNVYERLISQVTGVIMNIILWSGAIVFAILAGGAALFFILAVIGFLYNVFFEYPADAKRKAFLASREPVDIDAAFERLKNNLEDIDRSSKIESMGLKAYRE